jgi:hypothetical protein
MMSRNDEYPGVRPEGMRNVYLALYLIGAVLSGAGGNYIWMRNIGPEIMAPDRFTGAQAEQMNHRIDNIESGLIYHTNNHPDKTNQFDRRIATLEAQFVIILSNQQRILDRLESK